MADGSSNVRICGHGEISPNCFAPRNVEPERSAQLRLGAVCGLGCADQEPGAPVETEVAKHSELRQIEQPAWWKAFVVPPAPLG